MPDFFDLDVFANDYDPPRWDNGEAQPLTREMFEQGLEILKKQEREPFTPPIEIVSPAVYARRMRLWQDHDG